ncbi:MAG TPA: peptidylprolyl isomerase [Sphingomicrobium sp.]|jgi:peptidyl-prolyl cis-trans isomerase C|nr:peptidylprolyl isomerase [Sphingomicrobium sp.]
MISVNGKRITEAAIGREMQHHPADSREQAATLAATALVLRELLGKRAREREIAGVDEEQRIANLIDMDVSVPEPTPDEVARYYRRNTLRFMTPALYEAAHIFFPARADDDDTRNEARAKAEGVLAEVLGQPRRFAELAQAHSSCSSKDQGGSLGQVSKGDTNPELERAMATVDEGSITLVPSRHGFHILRLDRRAAGKQFPLEQVRGWIESHLRETSKRRAIAQYLQLLTAGAEIEGIDLAAADSPLVQ